MIWPEMERKSKYGRQQVTSRLSSKLISCYYVTEAARLSKSNTFIASLNLQPKTEARILRHKDITDSMWELFKAVLEDLRSIASINLTGSLMTKSLSIAFKIVSKMSRHTK